MLLDYLSASIGVEHLTFEDRSRLALLFDRIVRICPGTGEIRWEVAAWDSVRSDSHQVLARVSGSCLSIQGSPARVFGRGCSVFGSGPARALDVGGCLRGMVRFLSECLSLELPLFPTLWTVTRVDVTGNLLLDDLPSVRCALRVLRDCEGGRYRVSQHAGDTVYWSHRSRLRSGKAYAKGPHLEFQSRRVDYTGVVYSEAERRAADRLLRLELRLGAQWFRERSGCAWYEITGERFMSEWNGYFERMLGDSEVSKQGDLEDRIRECSPSEGQARAALCCWAMIQARGWEGAREFFPARTWYRHLRVLRAAGLGDADLSARKFVEVRSKIIECRRVDSWDQLMRVS